MVKMTYSKNERAKRLLGIRPEGIPLDQPCELGYHCPVCKYQNYHPGLGLYDTRLEWSEYNGMIWCKICNFDYPSCLCMPDLKRATKIFLDIIEDLKAKDVISLTKD